MQQEDVNRTPTKEEGEENTPQYPPVAFSHSFPSQTPPIQHSINSSRSLFSFNLPSRTSRPNIIRPTPGFSFDEDDGRDRALAAHLQEQEEKKAGIRALNAAKDEELKKNREEREEKEKALRRRYPKYGQDDSDSDARASDDENEREYHGTRTEDAPPSDGRYSFQIREDKGRTGLDFNRKNQAGFYTTTSKGGAQDWGERSNLPGRKVIHRYRVRKADKRGLRVRDFRRELDYRRPTAHVAQEQPVATAEWQNLVTQNRSYTEGPGTHPDLDIVAGPYFSNTADFDSNRELHPRNARWGTNHDQVTLVSPAARNLYNRSYRGSTFWSEEEQRWIKTNRPDDRTPSNRSSNRTNLKEEEREEKSRSGRWDRRDDHRQSPDKDSRRRKEADSSSDSEEHERKHSRSPRRYPRSPPRRRDDDRERKDQRRRSRSRSASLERSKRSRSPGRSGRSPNRRERKK